MDNLPINPGDLAVIVILLLSALLAFARGFVQEVLSIAGWVGAAAVTWFGLAPGAALVEEQFALGDLVSRLIAGGVIFVVALIVFSVATHYIAKGRQGARRSTPSTALSASSSGWREARFSWSWPTCWSCGSHPTTGPAGSMRRGPGPLVERGADWLRGIVPGDALDGTIERAEELRDDARTAAEGATSLQRLQQPRPAETGGTDTGYGEGDRQGLESLVEEQANQ